MILSNASGEGTDALTFLSLSEDRRYTISPLPQITGRRVMGSSPDGWLVSVDLLLTPRLFNPFTGQELPLPSLLTLPNNTIVPTYTYDGFISKFWYEQYGEQFGPYSIKQFRDLFLRKIILPISYPLKGRIAIAVCTLDRQFACLAFARVGDEAWLPGPNLPCGFDYFEDVIYNEGDDKFYAVTNLGAVFILECRNQSWEVASMVSMRIEINISEQNLRYIVYSSGDLLQVIRHWELEFEGDGENFIGEHFVISDSFKIFRFDPHCKHNHRHDHQEEEHLYSIETDPRVCPYASCWIPVNDLGDRSLFVGSNHSFSLHCDDHHELGLIKRNKVYFTDDNHYQPRRKKDVFDVGVFNLETNIINHSFPCDCVSWPPPVLFMSTPLLWDSLNAF